MKDKLAWLAILIMALGVGILAIAGYVPREVIKNAAIGVGIVIIVILILMGIFAFTYGRHHRNVVLPLHWALSRILHLPEGASPNYIHVSRSRESADVASIRLPRHFIASTEQRKMITDVIKSKLRVSDVDFHWHDYGRKPYLSVTRAPQPPATVTLENAAAREAFNKAKESAPFIGFSARTKAIAVDLDAESPHILVNAGPGGGKSTTIRTIGTQVLRNGGDMWIFDVKRSSHRWAVDLPGVHYFRDIAEIHNGLLQLKLINIERNRIAENSKDETPDVGQRILVIIEEGNTMISQLREYWKENKQRGQSDASPALLALREMLLMGRSSKMNALGVFQMASANALGGPEMREQFFTRILARYSQKAWNMLTDLPYRNASKHSGRVQVILGGSVYETQVLYLSEAEARELVVSARTARASVTVPPTTSETARTPITLPPQPITLRQSIDTGLIPMTLEALRKAKARDDTFPESVGMHGNTKTYNAEDLRRWYIGKRP
jgi:hypothetical protein